jgi:hypothetical protein
MNTKKKIVILDLNRNFNLLRENCYIIRIDKGVIKLKNVRDISHKLNINNDGDKEITIKILKFIKYFKIFFEKKDLYKTEFTNFRDDKVRIYNKIRCLVRLKELKLNSNYNIEVISDKADLKNIYKQVFINFSLKILQNNRKVYSLTYFFFSRTRFFLKFLIIILYLKITLPKKKIHNTSKIGLSIYPLFCSKNKINLYGIDNISYLNFLFTDETHINTRFLSLIKIISKLKSKKNFYIIERDISILGALLNYCISFKYLFIYQKIKNIKFNVANVNFSVLLYNYFFISILNFLKIKNYENYLCSFFKNNQINEFHYFLFEYNFGFFLADIIKTSNNKIKLFGYQHGIFNKNTLWFQILNTAKVGNLFSPDTIYYIYKESKIHYAKTFKKELIYNIQQKKKFNNNIIYNKIKKNSKNCIFFLGLHDSDDILSQVLSDFKFINKFKKIYIKLHPKNKNYRRSTCGIKKIKFVSNLRKIYFSKIYLSSTSSLIYNFKEYKIPFQIAKIPYKLTKI